MKKKKKGLTLLEVVISLAIFAILLIPLANLILTSVKINRAAEEKQQAKIAAQKSMEALKQVKDLRLAPLPLTLADGEKLTSTPNAGEYDFKATYGEYKVDGIIKKSKDINVDNGNQEKFDILNNKVKNIIAITESDAYYKFGFEYQVKSLSSNDINYFKGLTKINFPTPNELKIDINESDVVYINNDSTIMNLDTPLIIYLVEKRNSSNKLKIEFTNKGSKNEVYILRENNITYDEFKSSIEENVKPPATTGEIRVSPLDVYKNIPIVNKLQNNAVYSAEFSISKKGKNIETIRNDFNDF
ncbi:prepilin-type N-terminal cleavage/methylation domain-containing protein [Clostridium cavendishii DSM 21758]|uniref:Prepilin-type N-terminal cleavage/methylation domain-containing protein n=1 Tax=Clostridium cavendishii DSM 21758 TaxID=1121302 RepID=A0A1M6LJ88_9CLOT|nr:type II secretion system protein [Clostridium cavendishii]SHJ71255.1 prepilin-type N-terminal cleavage/methylation domain-containing protein [Clostridium cavendishii DSM 21758]